MQISAPSRISLLPHADPRELSKLLSIGFYELFCVSFASWSAMHVNLLMLQY